MIRTVHASVVCDQPATMSWTGHDHGAMMICLSITAALSSSQQQTFSLKPLAFDQPTTFELQCVRAVAGQFSAIVAAVYRPGSATV